MRISHTLPLAFVVAASVAHPAHAAIDEHPQVCFRLEIDVSDTPEGDYPAPGAVYTARGVRYKLIASDGTVQWDWADSDTGCAVLDLDSSLTYKIRLLAKAEMYDGNSIVIRKQSSNGIYAWTAETGFAGTTGETFFYTWPHSPDNGKEGISTLFAITQKTLLTHRLTSDEQYQIFTAEDTGDGPWVTDHNGGKSIFLPSVQSWTDKWTVSHELGHLALYYKDEYNSVGSVNGDLPSPSLDDADGASPECPTDPDRHFYNQEEWGTLAVQEGVANYYAASVWNNSLEADCSYSGYDCEFGATSFDECYPDPSDHVIDSAFEGDWTRFFWDLETDCELSSSRIFEIWDLANPKHWTHDEPLYYLTLLAVFELDEDEWHCYTTRVDWNLHYL